MFEIVDQIISDEMTPPERDGQTVQKRENDVAILVEIVFGEFGRFTLNSSVVIGKQLTIQKTNQNSIIDWIF